MDTVKRAAALLDRAKPGWEDLIDTETLDLNDSRVCIIGQLFGERQYEQVRWGAGGVFTEITGETPFIEIVGHTTNTTRWLEEIHARRSATTPVREYIQEGLFAA